MSENNNGKRKTWNDKKETFSKRKNDFKNKRADVKAKNDDFRTKKDDFGTRKDDFRTKNNDFRTRKDDSRTRKDDFRTKNDDFRARKDDFRNKEYDFKNEQNEQDDIGSDRLEGRNPVLEALKAGRTINKILVARGEREGSIKQIIALAREKGIVIQEADRRNLDSISTTKAHQGIIAYVSVKEYVEVDDILKVAASKGELPFIVILDEIADANNFGSILRTADAVGVHGVIIPKRRAVGLTPAVAKASAGAVEYVPVAKVVNLAQTIEYLKKNNIWVVGTDETGEKDFFSSDLKGPIALVVGSEGEGMGRLIREKCDFIVKIPMKGNISSLNAAVAGAIMMYETMKQRSR